MISFSVCAIVLLLSLRLSLRPDHPYIYPLYPTIYTTPLFASGSKTFPTYISRTYIGQVLFILSNAPCANTDVSACLFPLRVSLRSICLFPLRPSTLPGSLRLHLYTRPTCLFPLGRFPPRLRPAPFSSSPCGPLLRFPAHPCSLSPPFSLILVLTWPSSHLVSICHCFLSAPGPASLFPCELNGQVNRDR